MKKDILLAAAFTLLLILYSLDIVQSFVLNISLIVVCTLLVYWGIDKVRNSKNKVLEVLFIWNKTILYSATLFFVLDYPGKNTVFFSVLLFTVINLILSLVSTAKFEHTRNVFLYSKYFFLIMFIIWYKLQ